MNTSPSLTGRSWVPLQTIVLTGFHDLGAKIKLNVRHYTIAPLIVSCDVKYVHDYDKLNQTSSGYVIDMHL